MSSDIIIKDYWIQFVLSFFSYFFVFLIQPKSIPTAADTGGDGSWKNLSSKEEAWKHLVSPPKIHSLT